MENEHISLSISFESWVAAIRSLSLDQLLKAREYTSTLIGQVLDGAEDILASESEVDYSYLQALLAEGAWEDADEETAALMLEAAEQNELMFVDAAEKFPISDLETIDRLWLKYSNGRFGLSVQRQLWQEVDQDVERFCEIVGWHFQNTWVQKDNLRFTYKAPVGHLPFIRSGLRREVEIWSAEYFTDAGGEDQFVEVGEPVEPIEMWKIFANLLTSANATQQ
ncbi:MAG: GUN4 domain-containing protein [Phormidesmis sp.]